jgi:hypothetical protein
LGKLFDHSDDAYQVLVKFIRNFFLKLFLVRPNVTAVGAAFILNAITSFSTSSLMALVLSSILSWPACCGAGQYGCYLLCRERSGDLSRRSRHLL